MLTEARWWDSWAFPSPGKRVWGWGRLEQGPEVRHIPGSREPQSLGCRLEPMTHYSSLLTYTMFSRA